MSTVADVIQYLQQFDNSSLEGCPETRPFFKEIYGILGNIGTTWILLPARYKNEQRRPAYDTRR